MVDKLLKTGAIVGGTVLGGPAGGALAGGLSGLASGDGLTGALLGAGSGALGGIGVKGDTLKNAAKAGAKGLGSDLLSGATKPVEQDPDLVSSSMSGTSLLDILKSRKQY